MGVSVGGIIRYDFYELSNKEKAAVEIKKLCEKMKSYFHVMDGFSYKIFDWENSEFQSENEYRIVTPFENIEIGLHNGFLSIDAGYNYSQYFYKNNGVAWLRCMFFDIAQSLGAEWIYIVDEYHSDNHAYANGLDWDSYAFSFDVWKSEFPEIPLLSDDMFQENDQRDKIPWDQLNGIHIEHFDECKQRKTCLACLFPDFEILTTHNIGHKYILASKANCLTLLNENTQKTLRCGHFDAIEQNLNGAGFVLVKKNKRAYFDNRGKRITPYRVWHLDIEHSLNRVWLINKNSRARICEVEY